MSLPSTAPAETRLTETTPAETTGPATPAIPPAVKRLSWTLLIGMVPVTLDSTITNIALHTLSVDLGVALSTIQWVTTAYLLAMAVAVPVTGWLERRFSAKVVWIAALAGFLVGSIGSATAWNAGSLIAWRAVQGLAAGVVIPLMTTVLMRAAGKNSLGRLMALLGLPALVIPMLGPVLGGLILNGASWRWMFWINVPLCLAAMAMAARFLTPDQPQTAAKLDGFGLVLAGVGTAAILYGFAQAGGAGHILQASVVVPLVVGAGLLAVFVWWSSRKTDHPVIDLHLFRIGSFTAACVTIVLVGFSLNSGAMIMPLFLQQVHGSTVLAAGFIIVAQGLGSLATRGFVGVLTDRIGARWVVVVCTLVAAAATVPFAFMGAATPWWVICLWLFVRGAGLAGLLIPAMSVAFLDVPKAQTASSTIITRTLQQVGGAFGVAVAAVSIAWMASRTSLAGAYQVAFWIVIGFTVMTGLSAFGLPGRRPTKR